MQDYRCMLCKKSNRYFISIVHSNGIKSPQDFMIDLFGSPIARFLKVDDLICKKCLRLLSYCATLRHRISEVIKDNYKGKSKANTKALNWEDTDSDADSDEDGYGSQWDSPRDFATNSPTTNSGMRTSPVAVAGPSWRTSLPPSPQNLLMVKSSIAFDQRSETDMEEANSKYRYSGCDTPSLDREVWRTNFRGRRRSRGHNWTRRKGSQRSRSYTRSYSRSSNRRTTANISCTSDTTANRRSRTEPHVSQKTRILSDFLHEDSALSDFIKAYLNRQGENVGEGCRPARVAPPVVRTRYASGLRDRVLNEYDHLVYQCPVSDHCKETNFSLEAMTTHRVNQHNEMALFLCEQCRFSYLTQEHLDRHKEDKHSTMFMSYCIYCAEEFTNRKLYEEHLNEHLIHSFPCIYCDKFFLRKQICDNHIRREHPGKKKKIKRIKPQSILDRIDKYPGYANEPKKSASSPQEFVVKVLWQHGHSEETASSEDPLDQNMEESNNETFIEPHPNEGSFSADNSIAN